MYREFEYASHYTVETPAWCLLASLNTHTHTSHTFTGHYQLQVSAVSYVGLSLAVHLPAFKCGVHGEVHDKGVDAAVVVVNEHRVSGDLPACSKPAHTRGQEGKLSKVVSRSQTAILF